VRDKVEVAEAFLALGSQLNGLHGQNFIVACGLLGIDQRVVVREIDLAG
jgi:hypothetical protein